MIPCQPWMPRAGQVVTVVALLFSFLVAQGQDLDGPETEQWVKRLTTQRVADLEETVRSVYAKVSPSVVRIVTPNSRCSGVIVSPNGEIFTCAHHDLPPGTKVTVELADGSRVVGTTLGLVTNSDRDTHYRAHDVGMVRLDEKREWPAAELGHPFYLDNGQICLHLGYPHFHATGQPPLLRMGRVLPSSWYGQVRVSCRITGGDSGAPLVDLQGRVLGVAISHAGDKWAGTNYASVEVFAELRDRLRANEKITAEHERLGRPFNPPRYVFGAFNATEDLASTMRAAHRSTAQVLGDGKPVALGLIAAADGWVVTKRTELYGYERITCVLADGRRLEARIVAGNKEHDLAILKVPATDLSACVWAESTEPRVGQIVASLGAGSRPLQFGVVGGIRVANPAVKGFLAISGKAMTPEGLPGFVVNEIIKERPDVGNLAELLEPGAMITHLDDIPTPTLEKYCAVLDRRQAEPDALVGERVKLTVRHGDRSFTVFAPIIQNASVSEFHWKQCPLSLRRNGFPNVFTHDGGISPEQCGGPVVDRSGRIIGINIARADEVQTFAIPGAVVRKVVAELKTKAVPK